MSDRKMRLAKTEDEGGAPLSLSSFKENTGLFGILALAWQAVMLPFLFLADYDREGFKDLDSSSVYNFYVGIALMMFVGFGYLMTFLKGYGLGAVGFTMFITCAGVEWALILENSLTTGGLHTKIGMDSLIDANCAVAAVLISFGGLIGKISPTQIIVVTFLELIFYTLNKVFLLTSTQALNIEDVGGTIIIHVFGAYFGIAACYVLGPAGDEKYNGASYTSDLFSLIGTVFLWLYWPSFVSALVEDPEEQGYALINTVLALLGSTVVTFGLLPFLTGKRLGTVPVQNATLAGGVSIGATANFAMGPGGAMLVGCIAGAISCVGFVKPLIPSRYDTCGINNLHGMPGIFGGLVSVVLPLLLKSSKAKPLMQLAGLASTLVVAGATGALTGFVLKMLGSPVAAFNDTSFWDCEFEGEDEDKASVHGE